MDGMIQIHQGWLQITVAGLAFFGWGWRVLNNMESRIDKRLDKIDGHMDKLDGRLDKLDGRLSDLEKGQVRLEGEMGHLKERLDAIERKLDSGPLGMTTAVMAAVKSQLAIPFPGDHPPPAPQVESE